MPKQNIHVALFDVRPKKDSGELRAGKVVDLREKTEVLVQNPPETHQLSSPVLSAIKQIESQAPIADERDIIAHEVETALAGGERLVADLVRSGATLHAPVKQKSARPRVIALPKQAEPSLPIEPTMPPATPAVPEHHELEQFWNNGNAAPVTLARTSYEPHYSNPFPANHLPVTPAAREVEHWLAQMKKRQTAKAKASRKKTWLWSMFAGIVVITGVTAGALASSEFVVQKEARVLQNGNDALANLEQAKASLGEFDFAAAADSFAMAYDDFGEAHDAMGNFAASFLSLFGKGKSANNLIQAGQHISQAGESLSRAFGSLSSTNFFAQPSLIGPVENFQDVLETAYGHIKKARQLLDGVEGNAIPADKRAVFEGFRKQTPSFQAYIGQAIEYSDFLLGVVGKRTTRTYLVLLQNTSERRPTGGFPGTYAIVSFEQGTLKNVFVDDIYNPDGQIKANMIPPKPLQHITPNLGMRDANWFADFPASARKVAEYYLLDGGAKVDGVFAITPTLIARLLEITGPIEMPDYGVKLDARNFLAEIQDEVEHGDNRAQPKKILVDFQPKFFAKLAEQNKDQWIEMMKVLVGATQEKHILAYFSEQKLQNKVLENGLGGELKHADGDYLQVAFSNVKGGKTDAVTANSMQFSVDGDSRTLTITRAHNGGDSKYPFYNKENSSYVKIYVPKGSQFISAEGFSKPNYKPLIAHLDLGFKPDVDIAAVESSMSHPIDGIDVFEESGKTVFGFWLTTKPRKANSMTLVYEAPKFGKDGYELYWQKQSGSEGDLMGVKITPPAPLVPRGETEGIQIIGTTAVYDNDLSVDREIKVVYH